MSIAHGLPPVAGQLIPVIGQPEQAPPGVASHCPAPSDSRLQHPRGHVSPTSASYLGIVAPAIAADASVFPLVRRADDRTHDLDA